LGEFTGRERQLQFSRRNLGIAVEHLVKIA
jgi:hypothetical protein